MRSAPRVSNTADAPLSRTPTCTTDTSRRSSRPWFACNGREAGHTATVQLVGGLRPGDLEIQQLVVLANLLGHEAQSYRDAAVRRYDPSTRWHPVSAQTSYILAVMPRAGCSGTRAPCGLRVERIDPLRFLARCRKRRLTKALSVLSLRPCLFSVCFVLFAMTTLTMMNYFVFVRFLSCSG